MTSKLDFPLHGPSLNIVKQCGPGLSDIIQSKFGCVAIFDGVDFESRQTTALQRRPIIAQQKRLEVTLPKGVQLSVWKADLTSFKADAVVNAANTLLNHGGGLAEALSSAGGPQIQRDSDDYISRKGVLSTGDAIVLTAGSLPCKNIIHAVGPHISKFANSYEVDRAESLLQRTIRHILDRVKEHRLQSVAIPAISSGLFNFPLPRCADTIVKTVKHYYENSYSQDHRPQDIFLVNNDDPSVQEMERACSQIIGQINNKSYSQAVVSQTRGAAAARSTPTVQIGNVRLTLKKGKIEEQQTDVIVNTISSDRNLSYGTISKALLEKAGHGMQKEIYSVKQTGGYVFVTSPHNLHCKAVYHTCCSLNSAQTPQQILFSSVSECLWVAAAHHCKSIAFPAIGTGGLGYSKKEVAMIMSNAVTDFAHKSTHRMDVHFVIFPSDNDTYKEFEEQIRFLQSQFKVPDTSVSHASGHEGDFRDKRAPAPHITLNASSDEAICEADCWLRNLLYKPCDFLKISNNFIQYFGEEEHLQLARLKKGGVSIKESFENGHFSIMVKGVSSEDVVVAGLQVEAILCKVQKDFVAEEESTLRLMSTGNVSYKRKPVDPNRAKFSSSFKKQGPQVVKIEEVENLKLATLFGLKKTQLGCSSTRTMYQRIPAHFCEMVSHIGFHTEYAPPDDPAYGEGIYFADSLKTAMKVWKNGGEKEEYLYFVEAEVLTGKDTSGKRGLILPPPKEKDPLIRYDSVYGGNDISVIFSGYQALPRYIITCQRNVTEV
ncbi:protein mono-ADP-ribosyltransferase PARP9 [Scomber japonicus]|uniref:protein mono-ADP-ribosyltransferase PARP9 n=1 Tax=Scomber japonicus TaxID=13676 RepID=UPI0023066F52|nr:protein mono-ADP-ribosyltransferase PARP9 [Scomber japonicus]